MEILKSQWRNKEHTVFTAWINTDDYKNLPYGVNLESEDTAQVHKELVSLYEEGKIEPEEYEEPEINLEDLTKDIRCKRDKLLLESDKYVLVDYPIDSEGLEKIKRYRKELRDLTNQKGFPMSVVFPTFPLD